MSLSDDIKNLIIKAEGTDLHFFEALPSSASNNSAARHLVISTEIRDAIYPPYPTGQEHRMAEFLDTLDLWMEDGIFTLSEKPDDHPRKTMLAKTNPLDAGIWDIRCVDVDDGIRCLGAFADKNVFVALLWDFREDITDFDAFVLEARAAWDALFFPHPPLISDSLDDILTGYEILKKARKRRAHSN